MFRRILPAAAAAALLLIGFGCKPTSTEPSQSTYSGTYPINIVCTTGMVADLVQNVGGNYVSVDQLMGEGVDPHIYKAKPGDLSKLRNADAIFYSGRNLEGKMGDRLVGFAAKKPTVAVTAHIDDDLILEDENKHFDPHLWFDVSLWSKAVDGVRDTLVKFDPKHAEEYKSNAEAYQLKLVKLHEYAKTQIATIPKEQRVLVTAHDAFRYFGKAYDIEVKGIQGISTEDEASVKDINDLVDFITKRKVKAVFVETSVSPKNIKSVIEGCEAQGHKVRIGGELFSDAMGKAGTSKGTYEGMIRHNVDTIVEALK